MFHGSFPRSEGTAVRTQPDGAPDASGRNEVDRADSTGPGAPPRPKSSTLSTCACRNTRAEAGLESTRASEASPRTAHGRRRTARTALIPYRRKEVARQRVRRRPRPRWRGRICYGEASHFREQNGKRGFEALRSGGEGSRRAGRRLAPGREIHPRGDLLVTDDKDARVRAAHQPSTHGKIDVSIGDPGTIRTCDQQLRRLSLYPLSYGADDAARGRAKGPRAATRGTGRRRPVSASRCRSDRI